MADIEAFLKVFGDLPVSEAVVVGAAIIFFINAAKEIGKYYRGKWEIEKEKEQQMQNVINQVKMYPKWHEQSVGIQNDYNKAFERIDEKLDELNAAMVASRVKREEGVALTWRYRILRFDDEIRHEVRHTKEHFDQIMEDITDYENYCRDHPDFPNNKAKFAIINIKNIYEQCVRENSFL